MSVSAPVMKDEIENLPLNSRGIMNLAGIAPGIKTYAPQSGRTLPSGGAAPDLRFFNVYMDGVEMKSLFNGNIVGLGQDWFTLAARRARTVSRVCEPV